MEMIQAPQLKKSDVETCFSETGKIDVLRQGGQKQVFKIENGQESFVAKFVYVGKGVAGQGQYKKEIIKRLIREVNLLSSIKSRNLPQSGPANPGIFMKGSSVFYYYSEEYIPGPDLRELIESRSFPVELTPTLIQDVINAIKCLWEESRCVHRDIKPENIIFDEKNRRFVLVDPGIALFLSLSSITPVGFPPLGTLIYFSPEQVKGLRRQLDFRSDVYSLGVASYEAVSGDHPYYSIGMDEGEIVKAILNTKPPSLTKTKTKLPKALLEIVDRMLKKNSHARFNSCDKILEAIQKCY